MCGNGCVRVCVVCGRPYVYGRTLTCSEECHKRLVEKLVREFGEYKKIVDAETGVAYRVPTRDIIERGLRYEDLTKYPLWEEV